MILNIGTCGICDITEIGTVSNGRLVSANENYTTVILQLSNGNLAKHGICKSCKLNLSTENVLDVFDRIKETWISQYKGDNQHYAENINLLTVLSYIKNDTQVMINAI